MSRKKRKSKIKRYPTDLNDKKWDIINPLLPGALPGGRPRKISVRKPVNAILYVTRSGCAWRLLPHGFPPWQTVEKTGSGFSLCIALNGIKDGFD
ncbi:MAG: transposase [Methylovulum sp.]|nr:transposase [Methylovulum sp.]